MKTDSKRYADLDGKIIEESLATAIAFKRFEERHERIAVRELIEQQPLEYNAYSYWTKMQPGYLQYASKCWGNDKPTGRLVARMIKTKTIDIVTSPQVALGLRRAIDRSNPGQTNYLFWSKLAISILDRKHSGESRK
jgi:hypothetical protein